MRKKAGVSKILAVLLILIVILAALAAYGWLRPIETPPPEAVTLEEKARNEGALTIYGVMDAPDFEAKIKPAFEKQYPWATGKITYVGLSPSEISTRALSEYLAGNVKADVLINTLGSLMPVLVQGVGENYTNPMIELMNYTEGTYDENGLWTVGLQLPIVIVYNAELVTEDKIPDSWEDLADPYWSGKIALDDPKILNVAGSLFAHLYPILGETEWNELMNSIKDNDPILTQSASESFGKVTLGEAYIGIGLINDYLTGPPHVKVAWIEPYTALPVPSVLAKKAPHPNFAKLFLQWFASAAGQYAIASTGRVPMHDVIAAGTTLRGAVPPGIAFAAVAFNNPDYYLNSQDWSDRYRDIFG